jgi:putative intracellular protease/amidase
MRANMKINTRLTVCAFALMATTHAAAAAQTPVPKGNRPAVDQGSVSPDYFGGSKATLDDALKFQASLQGLAHPLTLRSVASGDLKQYAAVFVPGGPAPMIDLMADSDLGRILRYFHAHRKTTVLLCHAPIALLSAAPDPQIEQAAMEAKR